jgi:hypothetical protein
MCHMVTSRDEYKSQKFKNKLLWKIVGSKMDECIMKDSDYDMLQLLDTVQ